MISTKQKGLAITIGICVGVLILVLIPIICYACLYRRFRRSPVKSGRQSTCCIVIARFMEDVTELLTTIGNALPGNERVHVIIYNKGPEAPLLSPHPRLDVKVITLPNVGREGHTYLYHIIENYDMLSTKNIFLPASATCARKKNGTLEILSGAPPLFAGLGGPPIKLAWGEHFSNFVMDDYSSSEKENRKAEHEFARSRLRPMGVWFADMFGYEPSPELMFTASYFGIFSARDTDIQIRPKNVYKKLISYVSTHSNPEEGHYIERIWVHMLQPIPRIIWILWLQGWKDAPKLVQSVRKSWITMNPGWEVRCLDEISVHEHVDIILKKNMSAAAKSDLIRLNLLNRHGGVWADASLLCIQPLNTWVADAVRSSGMWMYHGKDSGRGPASWFIVAQPNCFLIRTWCAKAVEYWAARESTDKYFWMDILFAELVKTNATFKNAWHSVPVLNCESTGSAHSLEGKVYSEDTILPVFEHVPFVIKLDVHRPLKKKHNGFRVIEWALNNKFWPEHKWEPIPDYSDATYI